MPKNRSEKTDSKTDPKKTIKRKDKKPTNVKEDLNKKQNLEILDSNQTETSKFVFQEFNLRKIAESITTDWKDIILEIIEQNPKIVQEIEEKMNQDQKLYKHHLKIFPPQNLIFNAFNFFNFQDLKVIILGQDPYHQPGQAMGLSFSVPVNTKIPPSLRNIYKELSTNIENYQIPDNGDLRDWAKQGILLLNAALTVLQSNANEYQGYWTPFTDLIINKIDQKISHPIVFLLWGGDAKKKKNLLKNQNSLVLEAAHPSPLSASKWWGNQHFLKTNQLLEENNLKKIKW